MERLKLGNKKHQTDKQINQKHYVEDHWHMKQANKKQKQNKKQYKSRKWLEINMLRIDKQLNKEPQIPL